MLFANPRGESMNFSGRAAIQPRVGVSVDSVSQNTGDRAIGIAVQQELSRRGIEPVLLNPLEPTDEELDAVIVGGGDLIRPRGDAFYDRFRAPGGTILNAAGVWEDADDLDYLHNYSYVSARSRAEVAILERHGINAHVLPCTTTMMTGEPYRLDGVEPGEPLVGIHVVPYTLRLCPDFVEIVNAIPHAKVFIPFTHYNHDDSLMAALAFDRRNSITLPRLTPEQLHSVIGQMTYVVVSSLHASIFAFSQNVPFATVRQLKVANYFEDRGLERWMFRSGDELRQILDGFARDRVDLTELIEADRAAIRGAFDEFADIVQQRRTRGEGTPASDPAHQRVDESLSEAQDVAAVVDRDGLIGVLLAQLASGRTAQAQTAVLAENRHAEIVRLHTVTGERDVQIVRLQTLAEELQAENAQLGAALARYQGWLPIRVLRRLRRLRRGASA